MKTSRHVSARVRTALALLSLWLTGSALAGLTDLATAPLETSTATLVKPNILFVLDNSGSMVWDFMPDWVSDYSSTDALVRNSRFNGIYYDPAITYTPPLYSDGTSYASMTALQTTNWTKVPFDGFGAMVAANPPNTGTDNLFTTTKSGTTQNLVGSAVYYTFVPGEYCTASNLRTCSTQSAASTTYSYPAYLRWCTTSALTTCQASRIETAPTGGSTYTYPRYATATAVSGRTSTTVPGTNAKTTLSSGNTYARASTRTECANTATCSYEEEMTNYANWWAYYRTRMQAMKSASSIAFSSLTSSYRLGYMSINDNSSTADFLNVTDNTAAQKKLWYDQLTQALPSGSTPLRTALSIAGRYYAGKVSTINSVSSTDPMQYACQRNYTLLSTDGYWNESTNPTQINNSTAIGDQDGSETRPYLDGNATANTLADVAEYYYATDLRSSTYSNTTNASGTDVSSNNYSNKQQRMVTSTLGLGASGYMLYDSNYLSATSGDYYDVANGTTTSSTTQTNGVCIWQTSGSCNWPKPVSNTQTTIDDLWHAAVNGRGAYYSADNAADIKTGITSFLSSVDAVTGSSSAVAVSAQTLTTTTTSANYAYGATFCSGKWFGELARYAVNATTGVVSATADWSQSGAGSDCTSSSGTLTTPALLDNLAYGSRTLFTFDASLTNGRRTFAWDSLGTTMQGYFKLSAISSLSQLCASGSSCLPSASQVDSTAAGTTTGAGGINLVNYLRGDRSNEGSVNTKYYRARTHVLGDIVNSEPVYVKAPTFSYTDTGYATFKTSNTSRQAMVYVNANDGMLHAFNADSGSEMWAYIPSMLLPSLYKLADKNYAGSHTFLADGAITKADVYFDSAWHTILVSGLGGGGRGFYAVDVTTPSTPRVLWEFGHSTTGSSANVIDEDLGYSYGNPVVTKLSDGTWAVLVSSGYNNVTPGSGHGVLWVLNAKTGAIIKKIDNGLGTSTSSATVTGCSTGPCPSGLAKLSAWAGSTTDNTSTQVYGGDLLGNLWRFDISALTASGGTATAQLLATLSDASGNRQPVTSAPELGLVSAQRVVFVGTGAYLGVSDVTSSRTQSMYAIKDPLTTSSAALYSNPRSSTCSASLTSGCFVKLTLTDSSGTRTVSSTVTYSTNFATMNGWFVDQPNAGERIDTDPVLYSGTLVYVSNIPSTSGVCSTGGSSYINYVDYATGLKVSGAQNAGALLSSSGLSSGAVITVTSTGKVVATTKDSNGTTVKTDIPVATTTTGLRRLSWRRLTDSR